MTRTNSLLTKSTLAEVCKLVTDGTHDTPKRVASDYPLIKAKEIVGGRIDFDNCDTISEKDHLAVRARSKPELGDTLFTHIGASLGAAAYVNTSREFSIKNIALFKPDPNVIDGRYLYYLVSGPIFQGTASAARTGSAQPFLSLGHLRAHPVEFHADIYTQRRIAGFLSAYDDLIEVNTRRIPILEEMARRLFDEWFTRDVEASNTIERRVVAAEEVIEFDPKTIVPKEGDKPFVPMTALSTSSMIIGGVKRRSGDGGSKFQRADTLFARITPCLENGKTGFVGFLAEGEVGFGSTEFVVMRGRKASPEWVYLLARSAPFRAHAIKSMSGATGRQRVRKESLKSFPIVEPDPDAIDRFTRKVRPMFELVQRLARANQNLRTTRDLLLPRLISGEIDLDRAECENAAQAEQVAAE
jgi:type I restriction enzyme, S subunit